MTTQKELKEKENEAKERIKTRREKIAGYYLDMSKLTFTATVLAGAVRLFQDETSGSVALVVIGVAVTVVFYLIGNKILK